MGLLTSSVSITRYTVAGRFEASVYEAVKEGLEKRVIQEIDGSPVGQAVGWTSFENPYRPYFQDSSFSMGTYLIFTLRIDKKKIPAKTVKKYCSLEEARRLAESDKEFLSRNEKKQIKDTVEHLLFTRTPAVPSLHDVVWNYEESLVWLFTNLKVANEEFETLFSKSFNKTLTRLFPYTRADRQTGLLAADQDILNKLSPSSFTG